MHNIYPCVLYKFSFSFIYSYGVNNQLFDVDELILLYTLEILEVETYKIFLRPVPIATFNIFFGFAWPLGVANNEYLFQSLLAVASGAGATTCSSTRHSPSPLPQVGFPYNS